MVFKSEKGKGPEKKSSPECKAIFSISLQSKLEDSQGSSLRHSAESSVNGQKAVSIFAHPHGRKRSRRRGDTWHVTPGSDVSIHQALPVCGNDHLAGVDRVHAHSLKRREVRISVNK